MFLINLSFMICVCLLMKSKFTTGEVTFENYSYRGIDVAIGENVPYDPKLINQIKDMFTEGSKVLFKATHQKAYFGQVNIWVPPTWEVQTEPNEIDTSLKGKDKWFEDAALRLEAEPHPIHGDNPFTLQPRSCGEPGLYMHFTTKYLRNPKQHGNPGRVLVHEWAHYRYGIFNEYSDSDDPRLKFYHDSNQTLKPTLCPSHVKGWFYKNGNESCTKNSKGFPNKNCSFHPDSTSDANENVTVSLMSVPYLKNVEFFCNEEQHNVFAPTKHNELCNQTSTWSIINSHSDFKDLNASTVFPNTTPEFCIFQSKIPKPKQFVVALVDLSETMKKKIETVEASLKSFVKYRLPRNIEFAVIGFSGLYAEKSMRNLKVFQNLTTVKHVRQQTEILESIDAMRDEYNDQKMAQSINNRPTGRALNNTLKYLKKQLGNLANASVLLVIDGATNFGPFVNDMIDNLIEDELQVNVVSLGHSIQPNLKQKIEETSGALYCVEVLNDNSTIKLHQLDSALLQVASRIGYDQLTPLRESTITLSDGEDWNGTFVAEKLGKASRTEVFVCAKEKEVFTLTIWNATAEIYGESSYCHFTHVQVIGETYFSLNYTKMSDGPDNLTLSVIISSRSHRHQLTPDRNVRQREIPPNIVHPATPKAYLILTKGYYAPMIKAEVKFIACTTSLVNNSCEEFELRDDGQGIDNFANDGVYSAVTNYVKNNGSYSTSFTARRVNGTIVIRHKKIPQTGAPSLEVPDENTGEEPRDSVDPNSMLHDLDEDYDSEMDDIFAKYEVEEVDDFFRETSSDSTKTFNYLAVNIIKPAYVRDLTIIDTSPSKQKNAHLVVSLEWTSSGDDEYEGIADYIEIRYAYTPDLRRNFEQGKIITSSHLKEGSLDPQQPRTKHSVKVEVKSDVQAETMAFVTHFVVQTCDQARNCEKSNVARAYLQVAFPPEVGTLGLGISTGTLTLIAIFGIVFVMVVSISVVKITQCQQNKLNKRRKPDKDSGSNVFSKGDTYSNYSMDFTKNTEAAAQAAAVAQVIEQAAKKRSKKRQLKQYDSLLAVAETRV